MANETDGAKPAPIAELTREQELSALRDMLLIRRFEEKAGQLYGMGVIAGFCHLYIGQEAVVVGVRMASREGDQFTTSYRDHGHMLAMGMDPKGVMAELAGKRGGISKGKGGSMHMFSREKNFFGGHGIVGAPAPIGAGIALIRWRHAPRTVLIHGPPKSGKTRAALALERELFDAGAAVVVLDGQALRVRLLNGSQRGTALLATLAGQHVLAYIHRPANLEDVFLKLTGRDLRD